MQGGSDQGSFQSLIILAFTAHSALQLTIRITLAFGVALVVFLLAFAQSYFALDQVLLPVKGKSHAGIAFLLHRRGELFKLALVEQEFTGTCRVSDDVSTGCRQR